MRGTPRALRLCLLCEGGEVEDLPYFQLHCPWYSAVWAQFGGVVDGIVDAAYLLNRQAAMAHGVVSTLQVTMVAMQT